MSDKLKKSIISCLLAFGICISNVGTDIAMTSSYATEANTESVVVSPEEFDNLTLADCEKIVEGIDLNPDENGDIAIDLTEEELYALIEVVDNDKADIYGASFYDCETDDTAYSEGYSDFYYNQLNSAEKDLYNSFKSVTESFLASENDYTSATLYAYYDTSIDYERANAVFAAFYYENPQYGAFPGRYYLKYNHSDGDKYYFPFAVYDMLLTSSDRGEVKQQIDSVTSEWRESISEYNTPEEKEKFIAEALCNTITYTKGTYDQSIYGALILENCVCNGYAMAFTYLCSIAGLDTFAVTCNNHAWNMVNVGDYWYCVDATWMDKATYIDYEWFNKSYETFQLNDSSGAHTLRPVIADNFTFPFTIDEGGVGIASQPTDTTVVPGQNAVFTINAVGEGLTYQWQYSTDSGTTWIDTSVKTASYTTADTTMNGCMFRCVIVNANSISVTSEAVTLNVKAMDEVTEDDVLGLSITELIRFVDLFDETSDILTDAQLKAIEIVLEYDLGK